MDFGLIGMGYRGFTNMRERERLFSVQKQREKRRERKKRRERRKKKKRREREE